MDNIYFQECNCRMCTGDSATVANEVKRLECQDIGEIPLDIKKRNDHPVNTSDIYRTLNIPKRFDCPGELAESNPCTTNPSHPWCAQTFSADTVVKTRNQIQFSRRPTLNTAICLPAPIPSRRGTLVMHRNFYTDFCVDFRFFPRTNEFSTLMAKCGMYRNYSLNTAMDKGGNWIEWTYLIVSDLAAHEKKLNKMNQKR